MGEIEIKPILSGRLVGEWKKQRAQIDSIPIMITCSLQCDAQNIVETFPTQSTFTMSGLTLISYFRRKSCKLNALGTHSLGVCVCG